MLPTQEGWPSEWSRRRAGVWTTSSDTRAKMPRRRSAPTFHIRNGLTLTSPAWCSLYARNIRTRASLDTSFFARIVIDAIAYRPSDFHALQHPADRFGSPLGPRELGFSALVALCSRLISSWRILLGDNLSSTSLHSVRSSSVFPMFGGGWVWWFRIRDLTSHRHLSLIHSVRGSVFVIFEEQPLHLDDRSSLPFDWTGRQAHHVIFWPSTSIVVDTLNHKLRAPRAPTSVP